MDMTWNASIWHQFGLPLTCLTMPCALALTSSGRRLYNERSVQPEFAEFRYVVYHTLFWLDFYLSDSADRALR